MHSKAMYSRISLCGWKGTRGRGCNQPHLRNPGGHLDGGSKRQSGSRCALEAWLCYQYQLLVLASNSHRISRGPLLLSCAVTQTCLYTLECRWNGWVQKLALRLMTVNLLPLGWTTLTTAYVTFLLIAWHSHFVEVKFHHATTKSEEVHQEVVGGWQECG